MNVLVTGGAGFIGSNVAARLLSSGHAIRVLDDLSSGRRCNLPPDIEFIEGDIRDAAAVSRAMEGCHAVFHLAACVGRQRSLDDPILDASVNLLGTVNVLEAMRENHVERIIYSSSAAAYGELRSPSISEGHPLCPDSPYGVTKLAAEKMVLAYAGIYQFEAVCLRYFNIYGANQRYDRYGNVIPIFARRILSGEPVTIYGDGGQTRDFLNVLDVAAANELSAAAAGTDVYNLGSGTSVTIDHLARVMMELAGKRVDILYAPPRPADVRHCRADIAKARRHLGFQPSVALEDGLYGYLRWFRNHCL